MVFHTDAFVRSAYLTEALATADGSRDLFNLREVTLPDIPVLHFELYLAFLIHNDLPAYGPLAQPIGPPGVQRYTYTPASVLEMYKTACLLADPLFADRVIDRLLEFIKAGSEYALDTADVISMYDGPSRHGAGRLLFVDMIAYEPAGMDWVNMYAEILPSAFGIDLARRMGEIARMPGGVAAPYAGPPEAWCRYHEHTRVGGPCWRGDGRESQVVQEEQAGGSHGADGDAHDVDTAIGETEVTCMSALCAGKPFHSSLLLLTSEMCPKHVDGFTGGGSRR